MRATNKQFLNKFNDAWKKFKIGDLFISMYPLKICYACY